MFALASRRLALRSLSRSISARADNTMSTPAVVAEVSLTGPSPKKLKPAMAQEEPHLYVRKLNEDAKLPVRGSTGAAGYDLSSCVDAVVPARGQGLVDTGLSIKLPPSTYGRVAPRSGLAVKNGISTGAGVIDEDYRGPVKVVLFNHSDTDFKIKKGDRIAQLIIERIATPEVVEVADLDDTARGAGGFGSTGVAAK